MEIEEPTAGVVPDRLEEFPAWLERRWQSTRGGKQGSVLFQVLVDVYWAIKLGAPEGDNDTLPSPMVELHRQMVRADDSIEACLDAQNSPLLSRYIAQARGEINTVLDQAEWTLESHLSHKSRLSHMETPCEFETELAARRDALVVDLKQFIVETELAASFP